MQNFETFEVFSFKGMLAGSQAPQRVVVVLKPLVTLHALRRVECDLAALLGGGLVSPDAGLAIPEAIRCVPLVPLCRLAAGRKPLYVAGSPRLLVHRFLWR